MTLGCKDIVIRKSEFVAKSQFLQSELSFSVIKVFFVSNLSLHLTIMIDSKGIFQQGDCNPPPPP